MSRRFKTYFIFGLILSIILALVLVLLSFFPNERSNYILNVPPVTKATSMPLMIVLHNDGSDAKSFEELTELNALSVEEGFVTAFIDSEGSEWNTGLNNNATSDDVSYIGSVIEEIKQKYDIDNSRIFVVGFAEGGSLAYRVGCELSEVVTGVGSVGGNGSVGTFACDGLPVSYIQVHGELDNLDALRGDIGGRDSYSSSNRGVDAYVNKNFCTNSMISETPVFLTETWGSCKNGSAVKFVKVLNKGHEWFDGGGVDAETLIYDFLNNHPRK